MYFVYKYYVQTNQIEVALFEIVSHIALLRNIVHNIIWYKIM